MKNENKTILEELLGHLCNGTLTDEHERLLNEILLADSQARQYYTDYLDVHVSLIDHGKQVVLSESLGAEIGDFSNESVGPLDQDEFSGGSGAALGQTSSPRFKGPTAILVLLTTLAASLLLIAGSGWLVFGPANTETVDGNPVDQSPLFVAQITGVSSDVQWGKRSRSPEFLLRVRRGDRIEIDAGLVQVEYYSGAMLILQGPCDFAATGEASGRLRRGNLTGNVSKGKFLLTTPTASVIDLGTEFGVSVDPSTDDTDVIVFDGKVEVVSDLSVGQGDPSLLLDKGMAAKVDRAGKIRRTSSSDIANKQKFFRQFPKEFGQKENEISLVDLLSAKSIDRFRLAGVIAPDTGESDRNPWLSENGPGHRESNGYQVTAWHPFVDGVFIPNRTGEYTSLDSKDHNVDLPQSSGRTWGPVWSRRKINSASASDTIEDYWGTQTLAGVASRLQQCETGMIGLHANVGVTFDMRAMRLQDCWPNKFVAIVQNLDNSHIRSPEWAKVNRFDADFRVYVDGELRESRLDFTRVDGEQLIEVELTNKDRFLTLVSTDSSGGRTRGSDGFDHVVLVDPVLKLDKK